jgi:hypothetical protein
MVETLCFTARDTEARKNNSLKPLC